MPKLFKETPAKTGAAFSPLAEVAENFPEINYIIGTLKTAFKETGAINTSSAVDMGFSSGWNYADAGWELIAAVALVLDNSSHHPMENKVKALMLTLSSAQSITLTALNAALYASPAFAVSMGINLCINLQGIYKAAKKATFEGWLEDALTELAHIERRINFEYPSSDSEKEKERYNALQARKEELTAHIESRTRVYCYDDQKKQTREPAVKKVQEIFSTADTGKKSIIAHELRTISNTCFHAPSAKDKKVDKKIHDDLKNDLRKKSMLTFAKAVGLAGMCVAAAVFPPTLCVVILISVAAAAYFIKYGAKAVNALSSSKNKEPLSEPLLDSKLSSSSP